ncbi:MAG: hypothetical protein ABI700_31195 [Chloroflexota bacterium]
MPVEPLQHGTWWRRRIFEGSIFALMVLANWGINDAAQLGVAIRVLIWAIFVYALILLYVPLSALLWFVAVRRAPPRWRLVTDSALFCSHGYVAMSVLNNGAWILQRPVNWSNPLEAGWFGVLILHVVLLAMVIIRSRYYPTRR